MKRLKTKYEYWKWLLLSKQTKLVEEQEHRGIIAIHNQIENKMYRYDFNKQKPKKTVWKGIDWLLENEIARFLTMGELKEFYKSLPSKKKAKFWDYVYISSNK